MPAGVLWTSISLSVAVFAASGQVPPPPAAAVSPAPTLTGVLLGPAPESPTSQMPVNGQLVHLQGASAERYSVMLTSSASLCLLLTTC